MQPESDVAHVGPRHRLELVLERRACDRRRPDEVEDVLLAGGRRGGSVADAVVEADELDGCVGFAEMAHRMGELVERRGERARPPVDRGPR